VRGRYSQNSVQQVRLIEDKVDSFPLHDQLDLGSLQPGFIAVHEVMKALQDVHASERSMSDEIRVDIVRRR